MLVSLLTVAAVYGAFLACLLVAGRGDTARVMARFIPDCVVLISRLARDPRFGPGTIRTSRTIRAGVVIPIDDSSLPGGSSLALRFVPTENVCQCVHDLSDTGTSMGSLE